MKLLTKILLNVAFTNSFSSCTEEVEMNILFNIHPLVIYIVILKNSINFKYLARNIVVVCRIVLKEINNINSNSKYIFIISSHSCNRSKH